MNPAEDVTGNRSVDYEQKLFQRKWKLLKRFCISPARVINQLNAVSVGLSVKRGEG